ncbi:hypothetical protein GmRootV15_11070 [Variovorax sp. V15]
MRRYEKVGLNALASCCTPSEVAVVLGGKAMVMEGSFDRGSIAPLLGDFLNEVFPSVERHGLRANNSSPKAMVNHKIPPNLNGTMRVCCSM